MKLAFEPVKNQKFDIGRTINFTKCDCEVCNFMRCPKHNYALHGNGWSTTMQLSL